MDFTMIIKDKSDLPKVVNMTRLSIQTGYSLSHLSRVFSKRTNPSLKCMKVLAKVMDINIDELQTVIEEIADGKTRSNGIQNTSIRHERA